MKVHFPGLLSALLFTAAAQGADAIATLESRYQAEGAGPFSGAAGKTLWLREFPDATGKPRSCASCHTEDLRASGRHVRTGKPIEPLAQSVNAERFTDPAKIEKWFTRNCKWTLGRACTPQEKGDVLRFVRGL